MNCVQCDNLHCQDHGDDIEDYTVAVLKAIQNSAVEALPQTGGEIVRKEAVNQEQLQVGLNILNPIVMIANPGMLFGFQQVNLLMENCTI